MQERIPAQNIEAEQAVLSAILIDNNVMNKGYIYAIIGRLIWNKCKKSLTLFLSMIQ